MEVISDGYPVFKGLQRPLEFMGIRGRFLYYIAGAVGGGFFGYIICAIFINQIIGLVFLFIVGVGGYLASFFLQRKGLHAKKRSRETLIITTLFSK